MQSRFFPDGPEPTGRLLCACAEFSLAQPRKPCLLVHIGPVDLEEAGPGRERLSGTAVLGRGAAECKFPPRQGRAFEAVIAWSSSGTEERRARGCDAKRPVGTACSPAASRSLSGHMWLFTWAWTSGRTLLNTE